MYSELFSCFPMYFKLQFDLVKCYQTMRNPIDRMIASKREMSLATSGIVLPRNYTSVLMIREQSAAMMLSVPLA